MPRRDKQNKKWHVYILRCADDSLYTGISTNLVRRKTQHNKGMASKYTRSRLPVEMVWNKKCRDGTQARKMEWQIKKLPRAQKIELISKLKTISRLLGS